MLHTPYWHILDGSFIGSNDGLPVPVRTIAGNGASLQIENLDRSDPPGYQPGGVPRGDAFNRNIFQLTAEPQMPAIPVACAIAGFDPSTCPIYWRLVCRHILGRYSNAGDYRYWGSCETFDREWRGQSQRASFTVFGGDSSEWILTYNDASRVLGGHALLEVAAQVNGQILRDYVHVRISGTNPSVANVCNYLQSQLSAMDKNILYMLQAVFQQESNLVQFNRYAQTYADMLFTQAYHTDPLQPDCFVQFNWPDDPSNFPLASFDFGVGISQFTEVGAQKVTADIAWDWRENVREAANLFLGKLRTQFTAGITWIEWAMRTWAAYNGSGPQAEQYALQVAKTADATLISRLPVPALPVITFMQPLPPLEPPGEWLFG